MVHGFSLAPLFFLFQKTIRTDMIDLDTHPFVASILQERGLVNGISCKDNEEDESWLIPTQAVEVDCRNIKWSKSMLESFDDIKNGRYKVGDVNNFWRIGENVENFLKRHF